MNTSDTLEIAYPRSRFRRTILNLLGRVLLRLLTRLQVQGMENLPAEGPVILAGNHLSNLEPMLMAVLPNRPVELIGAGDLPFVGLIDQIVDFYGYIPVKRGSLDRNAMNKALGILNQGGVLGIYPEGGIWNPGHMRAQVGVSWLSHKAQAPVVPIGFSGFQMILSKIFKLKRPHIKMRIGKPIPALSIEDENQTIKEVYQEYADMVLEQIRALVDPQDFLLIPDHTEYSLQVLVEKNDRTMETVEVSGSDALAQFLFTPIIIDALAVNLKKPVHALYPKEQPRWNKQFSDALKEVIDVLSEFPGFLTYRLGMEQGQQAATAVREVLQLLESVSESDQIVVIDASAHATYLDGRIEEKSHQYRILPDPR